MASPKKQNKYTVTIGIECHVQLKTQTKLFSSVNNDAREAPANTLISHIDLGMPGALPVLNCEAVHLAVKAAFALGTRAQQFSKFDRKHYFYPDLPKGYQITQYDQPIIGQGFVDIMVNNRVRRIGITRAHLEEDAGKSIHPAGENFSLVDLNRAGTPLLEIVSEPDMHSAAEAKAFARELYLRMRYAGVSEADLFYGNMRFDVNVSVSTHPQRLGVRTETKNLNSFRSVEKAVIYETDRQITVLEKGGHVIQETRGWDDAKQKTFSQRSKEEAHDYRYFPEPDVPPIKLSNDYIAEVEKEMPTMPDQWRRRLAALGLSIAQVETLLEAEIENPALQYLAMIEHSMSDKMFARTLANWFVNIEIPTRRGEVPVNSRMSADQRHSFYRAVYKLVNGNKLSSTNAKALITTVLLSGAEPKNVEKYADEQGYIQLSDQNEIYKIIDEVIAANPQAVNDIKKGEQKAIGFLIGQAMKASLGRANPQVVQQVIKKKILS